MNILTAERNNSVAIKEESLWNLIDKLTLEGNRKYNLNFISEGKTFTLPIPLKEKVNADLEDATLIFEHYLSRIDNFITFTDLGSSKVLKFEFKEKNNQLNWHLI